MTARLPRYPVYVISKGRADVCKTARMLAADGVPFKLVVEPPEEKAYRDRYGDHVTLLPFADLGQGGIPARNWCWEDAKAAGHARHWVLDDNIVRMRRLYKGVRVPCESGPALAIVEDFVDRYENVAVAGLNYENFGMQYSLPPFYLNVHVYSCLLIDCALPVRWRGRYNEDTDLCLQVLSRGLCTVLVNAFLINKMRTMTMKGGNSSELYKGDGRLRMARSLERVWPYVVDTRRRFQRPQHVVRGQWRGFDTQLRPRPGASRPRAGADEHGLELVQVAEEVKDPSIRKLLKDHARQARRA